MMSDAELDELYDGLLDATIEILDSVEKSDMQRLGKAIDIRQKYLDRLTVVKGGEPTEYQKDKLNQIIILNKKSWNSCQEVIRKV